MLTKPKANSVVTHAVEGTVITFTVKDAGTFTFDTSAASEAIRQRAMMHGFIQRISDRAAISRDPETGKAADPTDKLAAMRELAEFYASGTDDWSPTRTRKPVDTEALLAKLIAADPAKVAELLAKVQEKLANSQG